MLATIADFLLNLFDTSDFPARWHCGTWTEGHGWLHIISDLGVFSAYIMIPLLLIVFVKRRPDTPFLRIFWLFCAFIVSCGLTHLMEAIIFWEPAYRLAGVLKLSTAMVSWATVAAMIRVIPNALELSTPAELRDEVDRQTAELMARNSENEQLLEELGRSKEDFDQFAYSVSHDLRAPLRAVTGFSQLLEEEHSEELSEEGARLLGVVRRNAREAAGLIDDLLEFSRTGRENLARETVEMERLARTVFDGLIATQERRTIELEIDTLPDIEGDRAMLRQVWTNLASNAVKYSEHEESARIRVSAEEKDDAIRYIVDDNGIGFDDRYTHKVFEVFERLHTSAEFEGTGVGLALVAQIVERHGGTVGAEAAEGEGAAFWFELPIR